MVSPASAIVGKAPRVLRRLLRGLDEEEEIETVRLPVRSERDAFLLVYATTIVIGIALLVGYLTSPLAGIVLFTLIALAALVWDLMAHDPAGRVIVGAARPTRRDGDGRRVLVVANEALADDATWKRLLERHDRLPAIEVLAPVLQSRTHLVTTDVDREIEDARRRLEETVAAARRHGLEVHGEVGDAIDPAMSISDELRRYEVDEVIVVAHPAGRMNWLEDRALSRVREETALPTTRVVVDSEAHEVEVEWPAMR
jgi:hypothetical protein